MSPEEARETPSAERNRERTPLQAPAQEQFLAEQQLEQVGLRIGSVAAPK